LAEEMREKVLLSTKLTCSAGIGPNKMISKISSDEKKPNGQFQVDNTSEEVEKFMMTRHLRQIPGVGPVKDAEFTSLGLITVGDALKTPHLIWAKDRSDT
jgi:DNA polymerase kappa